MASSAINILSGIAASAAGLAGEKVAKSGVVEGLDLASIIPALLGNKTGAAGGVIGSVASMALKSGLLNKTKLGGLADTLLSVGKAGTAKTTAKGGVAGLAAAILGNSGSGTDIASIVSLATTLAGTVKTKKDLTGIASDLGKKLGSLGVSFAGSGTAVKALDKVLEKDPKTDLFKAILKGLS